jgi:predicted metal-dependent enzyme (double-stranded beta helix superfamily)
VIGGGLDKLKKYYTWFDEKPVNILVLGMSLRSIFTALIVPNTSTVLHPHYKLGYIKMAWGAEEEQAAETAAGNPYAKNWQQEAETIVEQSVGDCYTIYASADVSIDGSILPTRYHGFCI